MAEPSWRYSAGDEPRVDLPRLARTLAVVALVPNLALLVWAFWAWMEPEDPDSWGVLEREAARFGGVLAAFSCLMAVAAVAIRGRFPKVAVAAAVVAILPIAALLVLWLAQPY